MNDKELTKVQVNIHDIKVAINERNKQSLNEILHQEFEVPNNDLRHLGQIALAL